MTREEAIQALNEIFDDSEFSRYESWYGTAMDMAIEALSAEAADVYKAHEEEHLNIVNRIKELQYAIAKTQTIVGKMVESSDADDAINEMNRDIIKDILKTIPTAYLLEALGVATFEELMESAEVVPQSEQYKKGFEDAKRAYLVEYARESRNIRKRQLEVMLNAQMAISTARPHGEWIGLVECSVCGKQAIDFIDGYVDGVEYLPNFCPNCGADMRGEEE